MYSVTRSLTDDQLARMQSGIRNAVRTTNRTEIPSTPSLYLTGPNHAASSTNWNSGVEGSNSIQMYMATKNVARVA